jgi:hypothetical protein
VNTQLATVNENAFLAAAASMAGGDQKPILKFSKGDWTVGQEDEDVPIGTRLAADIVNAEWGWIRWHDNKPVERRMVLVASGQQSPTRDALGHEDKDLWKVGSDGKPQDPWQRTIEIPVRELDGEKREFLLAGSSNGFQGGCKALFAAFGKGMRENAGKVPVIELGMSKYKHKNSEYGVIKTPEMAIVEWFDPAAASAVAAPKQSKAKF